MADGQQIEIEQLLAIHKPQLATSQIPERHWRSLLRKLARGQMDAGATFGLTYEDEGETRLKAVVVKEDGVKVRGGLLDRSLVLSSEFMHWAVSPRLTTRHSYHAIYHTHKPARGCRRGLARRPRLDLRLLP